MELGAALMRWGSGALVVACVGACSHPIQSAPLLGDCDAGPKCGLQGGSSASNGGPLVDAAGCGDIVFRAGACDSCVTQSCCDREATCSNSADCIALLQCVSSCAANDTMCQTSCLDMSQNGVAPYQNLLDCVNSGCSAECGTADGGGSCGILTFGSQGCTACVDTTCCSEDGACSNNPSCVAIVQCAAVCQSTDQACILDCETQQPDGDTDYRALSACVVSSCGAKCP